MKFLTIVLAIILCSFSTPNVVTFTKAYDFTEDSEQPIYKVFTTFSIDLSVMEVQDTKWVGDNMYQYYSAEGYEVEVKNKSITAITVFRDSSETWGTTYLK